MKRPAHIPDEAVAQLCPACGLCCDGTLFGDVELQKDETQRDFSELGLALKRKGKKFSFTQPCSCFDGKLCGIYSNRPARCKTFECRLLQRAQSGQIKINAALKAIKQARAVREKVRRLLRALGQRDERMALNRRVAQIMSQPIDLASDESGKRCSSLMLAVHKLTKILERDFLT